MKEDRTAMTDLDEYITVSDAPCSGNACIWQTAIGLQQVDGLSVSPYLIATAKENINGEIDLCSARKRIESHYTARSERLPEGTDTLEADMVSARIAELLEEKTFSLSAEELKRIHGVLFSGIYDHAGGFRTVDITKKEWVLEGETVLYSPACLIRDTLEWDFSREKEFSYDISPRDAARHISSFISGIWQIHPFREGNTRTIAVFLIRYLRSFGFTINNDAFANNSRYFRNALVRANWSDMDRGIHKTTAYLEAFMDNLLFGGKHELKNRYLHVNYEAKDQGTGQEYSDWSNCTKGEISVLLHLRNQPSATQKEIAEAVGKSVPTIKKITVALQEKGLIERQGGKRFGFWKIIE